MLVTLAKLLPIALAGAFLPTWTSYVILLLGTDRPVATSLAFVAGNATYRFLLGFGLLFVFSTQALKELLAKLPDPGAWLGVVAGILLIAIGAIVRRSRTRSPSGQGDALPRWMQAYERVPPPLMFGWALLSVASPGIQYLYLLAAVTVIGRAELGPVRQTVLLGTWVILVQVMLLTPIGLYLWKRDRAQPVLQRVKRWITTTGTGIFAWVFIGMGTALLVGSLYVELVR